MENGYFKITPVKLIGNSSLMMNTLRVMGSITLGQPTIPVDFTLLFLPDEGSEPVAQTLVANVSGALVLDKNEMTDVSDNGIVIAVAKQLGLKLKP